MDLILVIVIPLLAIILSIIITIIVTDHINKTRNETVENNKDENRGDTDEKSKTDNDSFRLLIVTMQTKLDKQKSKCKSIKFPYSIMASFISYLNNQNSETHQKTFYDEFFNIAHIQTFTLISQFIDALEPISREQSTVSITPSLIFETYVYFAYFVLETFKEYFIEVFGEAKCDEIDFHDKDQMFIDNIVNFYSEANAKYSKEYLKKCAINRFEEYRSNQSEDFSGELFEKIYSDKVYCNDINETELDKPYTILPVTTAISLRTSCYVALQSTTKITANLLSEVTKLSLKNQNII